MAAGTFALWRRARPQPPTATWIGLTLIAVGSEEVVGQPTAERAVLALPRTRLVTSLASK